MSEQFTYRIRWGKFYWRGTTYTRELITEELATELYLNGCSAIQKVKKKPPKEPTPPDA